MKDPERIWLQNDEDWNFNPDGRQWCEDKVWPNDPEDGEPVEYIRADLIAAACAQARRDALEEAAKIAEGIAGGIMNRESEYRDDGSIIWTPGSEYDDARREAADSIRAKMEEEAG